MGLNWTERGPNNIGGRTRGLIFDKNDATNKKVWAGSVGGGLWYTNDITAGSPSWTKVNDLFDNIAITTVAQEPASPQYLYFGTGEGWYNFDAIRGLGIWRSADGGSTWSQLPSTNNANFYYVNKIVADADGRIYAATQTGLYKSTDHGTTWTQVVAGQHADIEICADKSVVASVGDVVVTGAIRISNFLTHGANTGNAANWTTISPAGSYRRVELAVAPSDANRIYALALGPSGNNGCSNIWESTDKGANWTARPVPTVYNQGFGGTFAASQAWYNLIAAVDPNNANTLYVAGLDMCRSTDEGATWTQIGTWTTFNNPSNPAPAPWPIGFIHADHHAIVFVPGSSTTAILGNDGGVYYSTTMNTPVTATTMPSFGDRNSGYNVTQYFAADMVPTACSDGFIAGAQDNGTQKMTTSGLGGGSTVTGGDGAYSHIDQNNSNVQISAFTRNNYTYTVNNWASSVRHAYSNGGSFINPTEFDDVNNVLYTCNGTGSYLTFSGGMLNGSGSTLPTATSKTGITGNPAALKVDPNDANVLWIGSAAGTLNKVTNPNATPTVVLKPSASFFGGYISSIDIQKGNANHILVTVSNYGSAASVQESTDGGTTWTNLDNASLPDMPIRWGIFNPVNPDQILLATELGVWSTDNINGASTVWQAENNGLANVRVDMLQYRPSDYTVVAATHGRGIFTTKLTENAPLSTAVIEQATQTAQGYLGPNATTYFYSQGDGQLMCKIQNNTSHDYGCTTVAIGRGSDGSMVPVHFRDNNMNANDVMPKTISVTPSNNNASGNYTITLYYTPAEITAWTTHTGRTWSSAVLIKCSGDVNLITPVSPNAGGTTTYVNQTGSSATGLGFISATLTTGFSSFATGSLNSVLPVELVSFKGKWYNQAAQLTWQVVNQQAIEAYDVERSVDGQNFGYVGTVKANTQTQATYPFEDKNAASAATLYYRLKIKESNDSRDNYSKIVAIQVPTKGLAFNLAQNPVREQVQILFDEASNYPLSNLSIQIADMTGRVVVNRRWSSWDEKQLSLPIANLPNGTYILNVQTNTDKKAVKFVKN